MLRLDVKLGSTDTYKAEVRVEYQLFDSGGTLLKPYGMYVDPAPGGLFTGYVEVNPLGLLLKGGEGTIHFLWPCHHWQYHI